MRSSATVAARGLVMLVCLVGVPALALLDVSWSAAWKKFEALPWPTAVRKTLASLKDAGPEAKANEADIPVSATQRHVRPLAVTPAATSVAGPRTLDEQLRAVGERLQRLGATYYVVESWGNEQQLYRCYCRVALAGSAQVTRCFEAVDASPLRAMLAVLQQADAQRHE